jgi:hypothetical protein
MKTFPTTVIFALLALGFACEASPVFDYASKAASFDAYARISHHQDQWNEDILQARGHHRVHRWQALEYCSSHQPAHPPAVPEPSSLAIVALGLGLLGLKGYRSKKRNRNSVLV